MKYKHITFVLALCGLLAGCAVPAIVGKQPSETAPQLVKIFNKDLGQEIITWDNQFLFGPVPAKLQASGDVACMRARVDLQAAGYHPRAKDVQGQVLAGGGYYCYPKASGSAPDVQPPKLAVIDGVLGWDRPSAFGAVPADQKARGDEVCERFTKGMKAIAYHPQAQQQDGRAIAGGGFFCAAPLNQ